MKLIVDYVVKGSLSREADAGENELAIAGKMSDFCGDILSLVSNDIQRDYSSLYMLHNYREGLFTAIHFQSAYSRFPTLNRYYTTRVVYEWKEDEFAKIDFRYRAILPGLDKLKPYDSYEEATPEIILPEISIMPLNDNEQFIYDCLISALLGGRKLYIKLGDNENLYGEHLMQSEKLKQLLNVMAVLPVEIRPYISLAFSVDGGERLYNALEKQFCIVAFKDNGPNDKFVLDWTTDLIKGEKGEPNEGLFKQLLPMLNYFKRYNKPSYPLYAELLLRLPSRLDKALTSTSPTKEDIEVLENAFKSGKGTYRYEEISLRYTELRILMANSVEEIEEVYIKEIKALVWRTLQKNANLIKECGEKQYLSVSLDFKEQIRQEVKKWNSKEKIELLDNEYFDIKIEDITPSNWQDFMALYKLLHERHRKNLKYDVFEWKIDGFSIDLYNILKNRLTDEEKIELIKQTETQNEIVFYYIVNNLLCGRNLTQKLKSSLLDVLSMQLEKYSLSDFLENCEYSISSSDILADLDYSKIKSVGSDKIVWKIKELIMDDKLRRVIEERYQQLRRSILKGVNNKQLIESVRYSEETLSNIKDVQDIEECFPVETWTYNDFTSLFIVLKGKKNKKDNQAQQNEIQINFEKFIDKIAVFLLKKWEFGTAERNKKADKYLVSKMVELSTDEITNISQHIFSQFEEKTRMPKINSADKHFMKVLVKILKQKQLEDIRKELRKYMQSSIVIKLTKFVKKNVQLPIWLLCVIFIISSIAFMIQGITIGKKSILPEGSASQLEDTIQLKMTYKRENYIHDIIIGDSLLAHPMSILSRYDTLIPLMIASTNSQKDTIFYKDTLFANSWEDLNKLVGCFYNHKIIKEKCISGFSIIKTDKTMIQITPENPLLKQYFDGLFTYSSVEKVVIGNDTIALGKKNNNERPKYKILNYFVLVKQLDSIRVQKKIQCVLPY